ncbi:MAG: O-antigen ligase family protein [Acidobacteria bacterium]|nr:O-antigen ligase family protein [Acidobacteriota bacterium]
MKTLALAFPGRERLSKRRMIAGLILTGATLTILFAMVVLRLSMPGILLGAALVAAAAATVLFPEVGLHALILNAVVGLAHLADLPRLGPLSVPIAFELILAAAFAVQVAIGRRRLHVGSLQHLLFAALTFWVVVSLLVNGRVTEENLDAIRNLYLVRLLIFFLVTSLFVGESAMKRLVGVLTLANIGLVVASVGGRLGVFGQEKVVISEKMLRTTGIVHNPNNLAFELTTMLILAVFSFFVVERRWLRTALLLLAVADGAVILSTLSRSGFISMAAVLVFMFFKVTRSARVIAIVLIVAVLGGVASQTNLVKRFQRIDEIKDVDRFKMAVIGLNAAKANPVFGVGIGNFLRDFDRYDTVNFRRHLPTHDMYLDLSAQMGFPALILYLAVLGITWRGLRKIETRLEARGDRRSFLYMFGLAVQCFLVNLCVFGFSGDVEFEYSVFIMLALGILLRQRFDEMEAVAAR